MDQYKRRRIEQAHKAIGNYEEERRRAKSLGYENNDDYLAGLSVIKKCLARKSLEEHEVDVEMAKGSVSEFARELLRTDSFKVDGLLQEVREVVEGLKQRDLSTGPCWCLSSTLPNAFLENPATWKHGESCERASALMVRLEIK
jgi:hypothetical protein